MLDSGVVLAQRRGHLPHGERDASPGLSAATVAISRTAGLVLRNAIVYHGESVGPMRSAGEYVRRASVLTVTSTTACGQREDEIGPQIRCVI